MIEVQQVSNVWGDFSLESVTLTVDTGEYFVILGPCGSGKTLLLETIAGLHTPRSGRLLVNGRDVTALPPERRRVGLVYQQYALFPHLSVRENIGYGLRYRGRSAGERRERVDEMLALLDIGYLEDRPDPSGLSGGEAQKVALARALAIEPEVLLLDEPISSLDQRSRERTVDVLREVTRRLQLPVIHVTHDYTEAASLAHRIAILERGRVEQVGTAEDVFWRPRTPFVADFLGVANVFEGRCTGGGAGRAEIRVGDLRVAAASEEAAPGPARFCIRPEEVRLHRAAPQAENVFAGTVAALTDRGFSVHVRVRADLAEVIASAPRRSVVNLGVTIGSPVFVELPPESIHVMASAPEESTDAD